MFTNFHEFCLSSLATQTVLEQLYKRCIFSLECNQKLLLFITTSQESCRQKPQCDSFSQEHFLKATLFLLPASNCFHRSETIAMQHKLETAMQTHKYQSNYSSSLVFLWEFKYSFYLTGAKYFMTFLSFSRWLYFRLKQTWVYSRLLIITAKGLHQNLHQKRKERQIELNPIVN